MNEIKKLKLIFRFDDFILIEDDFYNSLLDIFSKNNIPINLGIIPYDANNLPISGINPASLNKIKSGTEKKLIDIQLHGYNHVSNDARNLSEFYRRSKNDQYDRIKKGKNYLDNLFGININTFIPPWNSYDKNTLAVLKSLNFSCISGNIKGLSSSSKIKYLPYTYENFRELKNIIKEHKMKDAILVVMFHKYSFEGHKSEYPVDQISLSELNEILTWINTNEIECLTYSEILKQDEDLSNKRKKLNNSFILYCFRKAGIPSMSRNIYYTRHDLQWINVLEKIVWLIIFFLLLFLIFRIKNS